MADTYRYDGEADALYIRRTDAQVARTLDTGLGILVDFDDQEAVVGVEVLSPSRLAFSVNSETSSKDGRS